jgi:hypothetical protein
MYCIDRAERDENPMQIYVVLKQFCALLQDIGTKHVGTWRLWQVPDLNLRRATAWTLCGFVLNILPPGDAGLTFAGRLRSCRECACRRCVFAECSDPVVSTPALR